MAYWSDLTPELLDLVATGFDSSSDTRRFRSVCSMWRSAIPRQLSTQFLPIKFFNSTNLHHCDIRLAKHTFFHISSSSDPDSLGWLIKTEEHKPEFFHLFNPFSRSSIKNLPFFNFPKQLDLTNIRIRELGHEYVLRNVSVHDMELYDMEHEKVAIITCSKLTNSSENYVILSTHNTGKLLMYRSDQKSWSFLDDMTLGYDDRSIFVNDWCLHYVDVVELNGTFYAVTNSGRTVSIKVTADYSTLNVTLLKKSIIGGLKKCLVKSADNEEVLMVDLYTDITPTGSVQVLAVEIFKLNEEEQTWDLVSSLGEDRALFLSNHSSFSAVGLPGCKGNCIYFEFKNFDKNKCCFEMINEGECDDQNDVFKWKSEEIGVFDFEKGVVGRLEDYLEDSQLFSWPPPAWVNSCG